MSAQTRTDLNFDSFFFSWKWNKCIIFLIMTIHTCSMNSVHKFWFHSLYFQFSRGDILIKSHCWFFLILNVLIERCSNIELWWIIISAPTSTASPVGAKTNPPSSPSFLQNRTRQLDQGPRNRWYRRHLIKSNCWKRDITDTDDRSLQLLALKLNSSEIFHSLLKFMNYVQ